MDNEQAQSERNLKQYYVYELRDPNNDEVFYVGKGTGGRAEQHSADDETPKSEKIRAIQKGGKEPKIVIIARFENESEAFAVESVLIHWVYGHNSNCASSLTNIQGGHGCDSIRGRENYDVIEGIDIPKREIINDGTYTNELIENNTRFRIEEKLNALRAYIVKHYQNTEGSEDFNISDVDMSRPGRPSLFIGVRDVAKIQCLLHGTGTDKLVINICAAGRSNESIEKFRRLFDVVTFAEKTQGIKCYPSNSYCKIIDMVEGIPIDNTTEIIGKIQYAMKLISYFAQRDRLFRSIVTAA